METISKVVPAPRGQNAIRAAIIALAAFVTLPLTAAAATFGTVVPIPGLISDIALDQTRGVVYAANFTASRIETISMGTQALQPSIPIAAQPSTLSLSPDGHYLVVGHYAAPTAPSPALTILDLSGANGSYTRTLSLGSASVLSVAFGNGPQALVVHSNGISLLDPSTGTLTTVSPNNLPCDVNPPLCNLPVPWSTFPAQIIRASSGVSGDGNRIVVLVQAAKAPVVQYVVQYDIAAANLSVIGITSVPALGPVGVSVDQTGTTFLAGWSLNDRDLHDLAQFPYAQGALNVGGHAFDWAKNLVYAQVPMSTGTTSGPPVLHVMVSDNLSVREKFQLRENLAGKALLSGDNMYAISDSGLTIFPIGALSTVHRVQAVQEDLVFFGSGCNQTVVTQFLDVVDPSGANTAFTLNVNSPGVKLSAASGTTPARIQVTIDPTVFQDQKGTATVQLQLASTQAVNVPQPVRLLINTRDPDQQGVIHNVPGKIVDVLADPQRDRFYMIRQDKNQVLVYDGTSFNQIGTLRTGNTPVQMTIFNDFILGSWLLVANDNSQVISVFDLNTLKPLAPIYLPGGLYARSIALSDYSKILATTRRAAEYCLKSPAGWSPLVSVNLAFGVANAPQAIGIFENCADPNGALVASPSAQMMFLPMSDGTVALFDSHVNAFISSRKNLTSLSGAYAALSDNLFLADNHVFNAAMVEVGNVNLLGAKSSGAMVVDGRGLISMTPSAARSGVIQRFSMNQFASISPVRNAEAASTPDNLTSAAVDQTGQTILSFLRTMAPLSNRNSIVQLSTSGFMTMPWAFDTGLQPPVITAITNAADGGTDVAPGGLISIWGSNLSSSTAQAGQVPQPRGLGDACIYANSLAMPLFFVSPNQINAQLPFNTPASASISLSNSSGQSNTFTFGVQPTAPAIFRNAAGGPVIIRTVDGKMVSDSTPIHLNQVLNIYMTGLGAVNTSVRPGDPAPTNPLAATTAAPEITIGGASIFTLWSGLAPGFVGVNQVNAQVPFHHIPTGSNIPFTITQGGASTTVMVRVEE
jgi:uncharacterized protein (TIGR03437 family)